MKISTQLTEYTKQVVHISEDWGTLDYGFIFPIEILTEVMNNVIIESFLHDESPHRCALAVAAMLIKSREMTDKIKRIFGEERLLAALKMAETKGEH